MGVVLFSQMCGAGRAAAGPQVLDALQGRQAAVGCSSIAPGSQPGGVGRRGKRARVLPVPVPAQERFA
jgi:hypothetical protein